MAQATTYLEVEIALSGTYQPAEPDVGIFCGFYEDLAVDGLYVDELVKTTKPFQKRRVDLLAGLDDKARAIVLANIQAHIGDDTIAEELAAEASDPMADRADDLRDQRRDDAMAGVQ